MNKLRQVKRLTVKQGLRQFKIASSILMLLMVCGWFTYLNFSKTDSHAAASGDYRSKATGNWGSTGTWEKYNGSAWVAATAIPSNSDGQIQIQSAHTVTLNSSYTADQLVIDAGGKLAVSAGNKLSLVNGTGTDLNVNGILTIDGEINLNASIIAIAGTVSLTSAGKITFSGSGQTITLNNGSMFTNSGGSFSPAAGVMIVNSGGTYFHNFDNGTVVTATWNTGSTLNLSGIKTNWPAGTAQSFYHVTYNSTQTADVEMKSDLNCSGNFTISGTGTYALFGTKTGTNRTLKTGGDLNLSSGTFTTVGLTGTGKIDVGGNLNLSGGTFNLKNGIGSSTLNIAGNLNISGGIFKARPLDITNTATINLTGNYTQSAGTFNLSDVASLATLNISGNFTHTGGTLQTGLLGLGSVVFNKSGTQVFTSGGTVSGAVNFTVNSGSTLDLRTNLLGSGSTGTFVLSSGAELLIGDPAGITSSGASGNIRVSGSRTYSTTANYTYAGTSAQSTGNGLPSTIENLTVNNSNNLTLTSSITVKNTLALAAGKIITGSNTLSIANSSSPSIKGYSASNYVAGNLRLSVNGTGTYDFPVGTASNYELLTVTLNNVSGFTSLLCGFTNANPVVASYPLSGVSISEASIDSMLNYGYWSLNPNTAMTSGTFDVSASLRGFSNKISSSYYYPLLVRTNATSSWKTNGSDRSYKFSSSTLTARKMGMTAFGDLAIGFGLCPPIFGFDNYTLRSGTANTPGAVYQVSDIGMGLDAWIEITDFAGGATVSDFDNYTPGNGYEDAWQPFVNSPAHATSSVGWKVSFKVAGTSTDTTLPNIVFAAIDVDGDGSGLREFVTAYNPTSISYSNGSLLNITNSGADKTATSASLSSFSSIDTNNAQAMFKVNYRNVSNFRYRTGVINSGGATVRQASLYFKSFATLPVTVLPIELVNFDAKVINEKVNLTWSTSSEKNNDYFTVERSTDGLHFSELSRVKGAGSSSMAHHYFNLDEKPLNGTSYYRLRQTDFNGQTAVFKIVAVTMSSKPNTSGALKVVPNPFDDRFTAQFESDEDKEVTVMLISSINGSLAYSEKIMAVKGNNTYQFTSPSTLKTGTYILRILKDNDVLGTVKMMKR